MEKIKEMIFAAVALVVFISAVTVIMFASDHREKLEKRVYGQNRYERILCKP